MWLCMTWVFNMIKHILIYADNSCSAQVHHCLHNTCMQETKNNVRPTFVVNTICETKRHKLYERLSINVRYYVNLKLGSAFVLQICVLKILGGQIASWVIKTHVYMRIGLYIYIYVAMRYYNSEVWFKVALYLMFGRSVRVMIYEQMCICTPKSVCTCVDM